MDGYTSSTYLRATLPSVRNVLTLDDRGFADLTGKPNEAGSQSTHGPRGTGSVRVAHLPTACSLSEVASEPA